MKKIKLGLGTLNVDGKVAQGNAIKTGMTGNANYVTPVPSLTTFGNAITDLAAKKTARENAFEAAKAATEALHTSENTYDALITQLASYAEATVAGDAVKLEGAGFQLRSTPTPVGQLGQVHDLRLSINGFPGMLHARWAPLKGAAAYDVQISTDGVAWTNADSSTKSRTNIDGLASGVREYVRVRGVGKTVGPWSSAISAIVP
jgi:hypothetical protein